MGRLDRQPLTRATQPRYPFARQVRIASAILKVPPERLLQRAGLPPDALEHEGKGATASQIFAIWDAIDAEARRPDFPLFLAQLASRGPYPPAVYAFSCSRDIESGLSRLALFKPLVAPVVLATGLKKDALSISMVSADPQAPMPERMAAFELVYLVEIMRAFTAEHIVPLSVGLPRGGAAVPGLEEHFGTTVKTSDHAQLALSLEDARRPLLFDNAQVLAGMEQILSRQMADRESDASMAARVKNALLLLLPRGQASAEAVATHLHVSTRSLHRHLRGDGQPFQAVLNATRTELSIQYLARTDISVKEISFLLGFRDPNTFYRAFRGWTGMTPSAARAQRPQ